MEYTVCTLASFIHHKASVIVFQLLSHVQLFVAPWTAARQVPLLFTISGVCSTSCPLSRWCYLTILDCVAPFSSCPQSFPASESFPVSWLFVSGGQSIRASASVLPMESGLTSFRIDQFDLAVQGTLKESSPAPQFESSNSLVLSLLDGPTLKSVCDYWKNHSFD